MAIADIEETYRRYFPLIREKCARMLRDPVEAQDIAQETFMRLWAQRSKLKSPEAVPSWIYRTSTRLAIDVYRRRSRTEPSDVVQDGPGVAMPGSPEERFQARELLARLASRIPRKELEVAILSRVDGMTHQEIAAVAGSSERTVRRLLYRFDERICAMTQGSAA